jgi:hypothetical protein
MIEEKPLFLPVPTSTYEALESGKQKCEWRRYGKRWNEKHCRVGRRLTLSKGYGKKHRLSGTLVGFDTPWAYEFNELWHEYHQKTFGTLNIRFAIMHIELDKFKK